MLFSTSSFILTVQRKLLPSVTQTLHPLFPPGERNAVTQPNLLSRVVQEVVNRAILFYVKGGKASLSLSTQKSQLDVGFCVNNEASCWHRLWLSFYLVCQLSGVCV